MATQPLRHGRKWQNNIKYEGVDYSAVSGWGFVSDFYFCYTEFQFHESEEYRVLKKEGLRYGVCRASECTHERG